MFYLGILDHLDNIVLYCKRFKTFENQISFEYYCHYLNTPVNYIILNYFGQKVVLAADNGE